MLKEYWVVWLANLELSITQSQDSDKKEYLNDGGQNTQFYIISTLLYPKRLKCEYIFISQKALVVK